MACAVLCAGALLGVAPGARAQSPRAIAQAAYHDGKLVQFAPAEIKRGRSLVVGGSVIGPLLADRDPSDHRPNVYVVSPGTEYRSSGGDDAVDFNLVVSTLPRVEGPIAWDVYWALVLDPAMQGNFVSERDLLLAAQESFPPDELFEFDDIPSAPMLREYAKVDSLEELAKFQRPDGTLPRVIIVPSRDAVRVSVVDPDAPPPEGRLARAWSHLSRHKPAQPQAAQK